MDCFRTLKLFKIHISVYFGRQSVSHLIKNQPYHIHLKHINVQFHFVSEIIEGNICIQKIGTANNPADTFIKVILTIKFKHC